MANGGSFSASRPAISWTLRSIFHQDNSTDWPRFSRLRGSDTKHPGLRHRQNRRLGATTLWAGTSTLHALRNRREGEVLEKALRGGFRSYRLTSQLVREP